MAKKSTQTTTIHWNGIAINIEWDGDTEYPEIVDMQLVNPSDLMEFADYAAGNKNVMDEIQNLLEESLEDLREIDGDYLRDIRQDR